MKTYAIYNNDDSECEYTFTHEKKDDESIYKLYRSNSKQWTSPGEELLSACDNGDGIVLSEKIEKKIDYSSFGELRLFFSLINCIDGNLSSNYHYVDIEKFKPI